MAIHNHAEGIVVNKPSYASYVDALSKLIDDKFEISRKKIVLIGHSFGARILFDYCQNYDPPTNVGFIALNLPLDLEPTETFKSFTLRYEVTDEKSLRKSFCDMSRIWFPALDVEDNVKEEQVLAFSTFMENNYLLAEIKKIEPSDEKRTSFGKVANRFISISGKQDTRLTENNNDLIEYFLGERNTMTVDLGHFPMIEDREQLYEAVLQGISSVTEVIG
ncbi:MAG: hypothetical protein HRU19_29070 [Pseudobacteriovorax sp.]|nr:hypothetical protein [Pseudobacteriovorax sp.]